MELKQHILERIKSLKNKGFDRRDIERKLSKREFHIDQNLSRGGTISLLNALKILDSEDSMVAEEQATYTSKRMLQKNNSEISKIPFFDAEAAASDVSMEMTPISAPAGTIDVGDLLRDSKAALRVYGNSMIPNYPPGCVVGLVPSEDSFIEPGEVYVIETRDKRLVKRLFYKNDESESPYLTCYSDNIMTFDGGARHGKLAYPPFDIPKADIMRLFSVTGVIKRNQNSQIINQNT